MNRWVLEVFYAGGMVFARSWGCRVHLFCKSFGIHWTFFRRPCTHISSVLASARLNITVAFRLIINFVVPWGNFQAYMVRPDADDGPFSSRHKNRPSEKAWRKFLEGNTVSNYLQPPARLASRSAPQFLFFVSIV